MPAPDTGNGATIAFGTSGFTAQFTLIGGTEETRESLETSHLGTSSRKTFQPDDLYDPGGFEAEFWWNPNFSTFPPISGAVETVTITFPNVGSTSGTLAGTAFLTARRGPDLRNGELMGGRISVKWSGGTGPTYTAGT